MVLVLGVAGRAEASGLDLRLESVSRGVAVVEGRLAALEREYEHRRGLIGAHAADVRFENAIFAFLVGDYRRACPSFFALVESDALVDSATARDAEWYLAECLMEDGNLVTAVEAYGRIIRAGETHPFFNDAVRRQLEAMGYLNDSKGFYEVYNRYIVTSVVPMTDKVRYSMGKSFYHQGDLTRAKSLFAEVSEASEMFTRARYFMGAVLVAEGQLASAIPQFERVTQHVPPMKAESYFGAGGIEDFAARRALESEVVELARLALGRIHYEMGDYRSSQRYYREVTTESDQFAEQLYELVWVYLKQEQWLDAVNQIEIFLIAFPEHQYAFQMRLLLGHLHMRRGAYERALVSYEEVVEKYGPVQQYLQDIRGSSTRPNDFFNSLVETENPEEVDQAIPAFAVNLLAEDEQVSRAVKIRRELDRQDLDLVSTKALIQEIAPIIQGGSHGVGTFLAGRTQIGGVQNDSLKLRLDVIDAELAVLEAEPPAGLGDQLAKLRTSFDALSRRFAEIRRAESSAAAREGAYARQVDAVQRSASLGSQVAAQQLAELQELKRRLSDNAGDLSQAEFMEVRREIAELEASLASDMGGLTNAAAPATKTRVMGAVRSPGDLSVLRAKLGGDIGLLHEDVLPVRRRLAGQEAVFGELDVAWERATAVEQRAQAVMAKLERAEAVELKQMRVELTKHMDAVVALNSELGAVSGTADTLAADVTREGIGRVEGEFNETVMGADRGIVDVYWTRKSQVSNEIERLGEERALRTRELDDRFKMIRQRMGTKDGGQ